ncbi:UNVERIFIED_CONTAM: hypothetical protein Slati_3487500 [Sesamum latifolium]|uniref:Uncharacterized protein n=1 Tax=Sesamum latifolium TaxID=2727402 RepID=A0AAW2UGR5_9LAMI
MIRSEFSGSCKEARQNILGISWDENGYVLDKPLPTALPEGSLPEERLTFDKWLEDNRKVCSIILASMTNEIQKKYDRYAAIKAFFGTKMAEGSSVQSHGVKMLSLVKKLEDLKAGLENDTYIDVILQSLLPSCDPFIVNYNMNGLEREASTSKAKGKGARRWKRKKGKGTAVTATASTGGAPVARQERAKEDVLSGRGQMICGAHIWNNLQVLERSRKLSKDEMVLRLGDGRPLSQKSWDLLA